MNWHLTAFSYARAFADLMKRGIPPIRTALRLFALEAGSPWIIRSTILGFLLISCGLVATATAAPNLGKADSTPVFYATDYGVVADGTTNNTASIQAAIDAAEINGGTILFPSGEIEFTTLVTINDNGVILQGVGGNANTPSETTQGTVLLFNPPAASISPPGMLITTCQGVGFRDMSLNATDGQSGDFINFTDASLCWMENCRITFNALEAAGLAAITLTAVADDAECTGNRFYNCYIGATGTEGTAAREGYGVHLTCVGTVTEPFVTNNSFIMCTLANFNSPGAAVRLDGIAAPSCPCNNNRFIGTLIGVPADGDRAGIDANNSDRNHFYGCTVDGESADTPIEFDSASEGNVFMGNVDGIISDLQTTPSSKLSIIDMAPGGSQEIAFPWITLFERDASPPATATDGTLWMGSLTGTADTLWVRLDGAWVKVAPRSVP